MFEELFIKSHFYMMGRRIRIICTFVVIMAVFAYFFLNIDRVDDIYSILPVSDVEVANHIAVMNHFRQTDRIFIDIGVEQGDENMLAPIADALFSLLNEIEDIDEILYKLDISDINDHLHIFRALLPHIIGAVPDGYAVLENNLHRDALERRFHELKRNLARMDGMVTGATAQVDPLGIFTLKLPQIASVQSRISGAQIFNNRIISENGRHVLLIAIPVFSASDAKRGEKLINNMLEAAEHVKKQFPDYSAEILISGGVRVASDNALMVEKDMLKVLIISITGMVVITLVTFSRKWLALLSFLPTCFGALTGGALLYLLGKSVSAITLASALVLIGISVDYAIHVLYHLDSRHNSNPKYRAKVLASIAVPVLLGALTTISAFLVMLLSPVEAHRYLGIIAATGITGAAFFSLWVLPLIVPPTLHAKTNMFPMKRMYNWVQGWINHNSAFCLMILIVITIVTAFGIGKFEFDCDINNLSGVKPETAAIEKHIAGNWPGAVSLTAVVVSGMTAEEVLRDNEDVAAVLQRLNEEGVIDSFNSLAPIFPSRSNRQNNIAKWQAFWSKERLQQLERDLEEIGKQSGFRSDVIMSSIAWVNQPSEVMLEEIVKSDIGNMIKNQILYSKGQWMALTVVQVSSDKALTALKSALSNASVDSLVISNTTFANVLNDATQRTIKRLGLISFIAVVILLSVYFGSFSFVYIALLPVVIGLFWTLGVMGLTDLRINVMNLLFILFAIGVGIDYSLFHITAHLDKFREKADRTVISFGSVTVCTATTLVGFGSLMFAKHPALVSIGYTAFLSLLFVFIAANLCVPLCMRLLLRRDATGAAPKLYHLACGIWCLFYLATAQLLLLGIVLPVTLVVFSKNPDRRKALIHYLSQKALWFLVRFYPFPGKLKRKNVTSDTFKRPAIIVSNHLSVVDVPVLSSLPCDLRLTIKERWRQIPLIRWTLGQLGHINVKDGIAEQTLAQCEQAIHSGAFVHFFPEGSRSKTGVPARFHKGAFALAVKTGLDIIPVVLCDTWTCLPCGALWVENFDMSLCVLPPIGPESFDYGLGAKALANFTQTRVYNAWKEELEKHNEPRILRKKVGRLYRHHGASVEMFVYWKMKTDPLFLKLHQVVPIEGVILDLGCGYGLADHWLHQSSPQRQIFGVDYDHNKIRVARLTAQSSEKLYFEKHDILTMEYPRSNVVLLFDVLHYFPRDQKLEILQNAWTSLGQGGQLIIRDTFRSKSSGYRLVRWGENWAVNIGHNRARRGLHFASADDYIAILTQSGFCVDKLENMGGFGSNVMIICRRK